MSAAFISVEGIDGSGKSTQLQMLAAALRARGHVVVTTREPGGTALGTRLRAALLDAREQVDPLAELLLYAADRAQHLRRLVRPALDAGQIVLTDRYADATRAYQGAGRGFAPQLIDEVIAIATGGLQPDLTLLFDLSVERGRERTHRRAHGGVQVGDRLDSEDAAFHQRVREAYLRLVEREPARVRVFNASLSAEATHAEVMAIVLPFLENLDQHAERRGTSLEATH